MQRGHLTTANGQKRSEPRLIDAARRVREVWAEESPLAPELVTDLTRLLVKESTSFDRLLRQLEIHVVRIDQARLDGETRHQNAEHDLLGRGTEHRTGVASENGRG